MLFLFIRLLKYASGSRVCSWLHEEEKHADFSVLSWQYFDLQSCKICSDQHRYLSISHPFFLLLWRFAMFLFVLYLVLSPSSAVHHKAHLSLMTHDPFLLYILKKVMDLNSLVKETFHFPNLQIVRPQGNLKIWLMINYSNEMGIDSKILKNDKSRTTRDSTLSGRVSHICFLFVYLFIFKSLTFVASQYFFFLIKELARFLY